MSQSNMAPSSNNTAQPNILLIVSDEERRKQLRGLFNRLLEYESIELTP